MAKDCRRRQRGQAIAMVLAATLAMLAALELAMLLTENMR